MVRRVRRPRPSHCAVQRIVSAGPDRRKSRKTRQRPRPESPLDHPPRGDVRQECVDIGGDLLPRGVEDVTDFVDDLPDGQRAVTTFKDRHANRVESVRLLTLRVDDDTAQIVEDSKVDRWAQDRSIVRLEWLHPTPTTTT